MAFEEKSIMNIFFKVKAVSLLFLSLLILSCGQKGPLYIQDQKKVSQQTSDKAENDKAESNKAEMPVEK